MKYHEMMGSDECPYQLSLDLEKGTQFPGKPPYPQLTVVSNETAHVRELRWQNLVVKAMLPEIGKREDVRIMRLVAVLEGGEEIELSRVALPADVVEELPPDPTTCASCGCKIPIGAGVLVERKYYHHGCVV